MEKKLELLIIFIFVLAFIPIINVSAVQVYVGVQITATTPTDGSGNADPGRLWCLPVGTTMGFLEGDPPGSGSYIGGYTETTAPTCPGNTIWSPLMDLTNEAPYTIRIHPVYPGSCSGYFDGYYCWETWDVPGENKNCIDVCGRYGQTPADTTATTTGDPSGLDCYEGYLGNCTVAEKLKGSSCSSCTDSNAATYFSKTTDDCFYNDHEHFACSWSDADYVRACMCVFEGGGADDFNFSYTPTGL